MSQDGNRKPAANHNLRYYILAFLAAIAVAVALDVFVVHQNQQYARRHCEANLKQIGIALQNYHSVNKCFPPVYLADAEGKPLHSWRVLLLPYFEGGLIPEPDLSQPWDSPRNRELLWGNPSIYNCRSEGAESETIDYVAIVGPATAWEPGKSVNARQITDGLANTICIIEVRDSGIHWVEPRDLTVEEAINAITNNQSNHAGGSQALFCDGSVQFIKSSTPPEVLRVLLTKAGGEIVSLDKYGNFRLESAKKVDAKPPQP